MAKDIEEMNQTDLEAAARDYGANLAQMLAIANVPDEQKQAWAALIPEMDFEQLDKLQTILQRYIDAQALEEMDDVLFEMKKAKATYGAAQKVNEEKAVAGLDAVMQQVKAAEEKAQSN